MSKLAKRLVVSLVVDEKEPEALRSRIRDSLKLPLGVKLFHLGCCFYDSRFCRLADRCHGYECPTVVVVEFDIDCDDAEDLVVTELLIAANATGEPECEMLPSPFMDEDVTYDQELAAGFCQIVRHGPDFVR